MRKEFFVIAVCERCQLGVASQIYRDENVLVPLEHHLVRFYDEVRAAVSPAV